MKQGAYPQNNYPQNLLSFLDGPSVSLTQDRLAGLSYALSSLSEQAQLWIRLRFRENRSAEETAMVLELSPEAERRLERDIRSKLRETSRWNWILRGIEGNLNHRVNRAHAKAYEQGYRQGLEDGLAGRKSAPQNTVTLSLPISALPLSARVRGALERATLLTVSALAELDAWDIQGIQGLGSRGAGEVGLALRQAGILGTPWEKYIRD